MTRQELENLYRTHLKRELGAGDIQALGGESGPWQGMSQEDFLQNTIMPSEEYTFGPYRKLLSEWYGMKPATPATFKYTPEEEAAAKLSVGQEFRPFYQEQATQSGQDFKTALTNAREGFSRRGLWGAAGGTEQKIDPATGLAYTTGTQPTTTGGPQSGLRQVGEQRLGELQERQSTAFGRAYTEAVAGGSQGRQAEAQDIYEKTIRQPYADQYQAWLAQLNALQAGLK